MRIRVTSTTFGWLLTAAVVTGGVAALQAQDDAAPTGAYFFKSYCASCHGTGARGDGPLAASMRRKPADLTTILKRNKGAFPSDRVFQIIDGRTKVAGHGGDMPVWGDVFQRAIDVNSPDAVKARIEALVRYLESIQEREGV
jgi:mono/diheme cytochrome c family protein